MSVGRCLFFLIWLRELRKHERALEPSRQESGDDVGSVPQPPEDAGRGDQRGRSGRRSGHRSSAGVASALVLVQPLPHQRRKLVRNLKPQVHKL